MELSTFMEDVNWWKCKQDLMNVNYAVDRKIALHRRYTTTIYTFMFLSFLLLNADDFLCATLLLKMQKKKSKGRGRN
jgi:hypothetical protein